MYLRKIRPRTTCLYSAASMLLRRASAAAQSFASRPSVALGSWVVVPSFFLRAICSEPPDTPYRPPPASAAQSMDRLETGRCLGSEEGCFAAGWGALAALREP